LYKYYQVCYSIFSFHSNIIYIPRKPIVCGIASLGLDHVKILGNTIEQIAWQKAGILKPNVPGVTVPQLPEAMHVLNERAEEKHVKLTDRIKIEIEIIFCFSVY
jgi:folylpolyglutamate synthase/dihydropteroate synthase